MRKATLIFIMLVFVGSIMFVNFFGLTYKVYDKYQYVERIEIDNVSVSDGLRCYDQRLLGNTYWIYIEYETGYYERTGKEQILMITPHCYPDNANDKSVIIEHGSTDAYEFDSDTPVPTIIYRNINTTSPQAFSFTLRNKMSGVKISIMLFTKFVDTLTKE